MKRPRGRTRAVLLGAGRAGAAGVALLFACLSYSWLTLPDVRPLRVKPPGVTAFMRLRAVEAGREGRPSRRLQTWVTYRRISPLLVRAVLVAEDARFWGHEGVDFAEIRASVERDWTTGQLSRGGSTITQQLAKNLYLSPSRNPYRKIVELLITRRLEAELSKTRILEIYLNVIEWGDGVWGAEAAARTYFGSAAADLTPDEAALLAGAIINPHLYDPAHPNGRLRSRQQIILSRMGVTTPSPESESIPSDSPAAKDESSPASRSR